MLLYTYAVLMRANKPKTVVSYWYCLSAAHYCVGDSIMLVCIVYLVMC